MEKDYRNRRFKTLLFLLIACLTAMPLLAFMGIPFLPHITNIAPVTIETTTSTSTSTCGRMPINYTYTPTNKRYFVALNLHNSQSVIPNLASVLLALADILTPSNMFVSVYENGSDDDTKVLLLSLKTNLDLMGVPNSFILDDFKTNWTGTNRIEVLADYRNKAIAPLYNHTTTRYDQIIFINDVFLCVDDILLLISQSELQKSDITCGFDYVPYAWKGPGTMHYDTWVTRPMSGQMLDPTDAVLFRDDEEMAWRYMKGLPVQGYSCWGG
jgi:alpha-1,3-mannosyltransferase